MYVDAHIHLYAEEFQDNVEEVLSNASKEDVDIILSVSEDSQSALKNLEILNTYRTKYKLYVGIGIHPYTSIYNSEDLDKVVDLIAQHHDSIICIGEVGLDRKYKDSMKMWDKQVDAFTAMIHLSKEYLKPLNIHSRRAARDVLSLLYRNDVSEAYFHWYTDDEDTLREIIELDYLVGFTPALLTSKRIQRFTSIVPLTHVLTESDGPVTYYGPLDNNPGEPKHVKLIINKLAELYEEDPVEVTIMVRENFKRLFRIQYG